MSIEANLAQEPHLNEALQQTLEPLVPVVVPAIKQLAGLSNRALLFAADLSQRFSQVEPWQWGGYAGLLSGAINFVAHDSDTAIGSTIGLCLALGATGVALDPSGSLSAIAIGGITGGLVGKGIGNFFGSLGNDHTKIVTPLDARHYRPKPKKTKRR